MKTEEWLSPNDSIKYATRRNAKKSDKWSAGCEEWIDNECFYRNRRRYYGMSSYCKDCDDERRGTRKERKARRIAIYRKNVL